MEDPGGTMAKYSTIMWDVGGVILTNGWDHNERKVVFDDFKISDVDRKEFEELHEVENDPWEKGHINFEDYLARTLFTKPRDFTPEEMMEAIRKQSLLLPNTAMPVVKELAASKKYFMGTLNNESRELNDYRVETFGFKNLFQLFLNSGYIGLRKPGGEIFHLAVEVLQRDPTEVIFIDDRANNVASAAALGIHAIQYKNEAELRSHLGGLGVL
jgi:putative hydrolase of the HAD superfamily